MVDHKKAYIVGHGGKSGSGARAPRMAPDTLYNNSTAYIIDALGHGPIKGLVDDYTRTTWEDATTGQENPELNKEAAILFDNLPLRTFFDKHNDNGVEDSFTFSNTRNFSGVDWFERVGGINDATIPGFNQSVVDVAYNNQPLVTHDNPGIVSFGGNVNIDDIIVVISVSSLSRTYFQKLGDQVPGDIKPETIEYKIEVQEGSDPYREVLTTKIVGKHTSPYQKEHVIQLENVSNTALPYSVKVTRITNDFNDPDASRAYQSTGDLYLNTIQGVSNLKLTYPEIAKIGLHINAREFGDRILSRQYDVEGLIIQVPSNYDPETRTYTGFWDGSFKREYSNNPAWVVYDLITNRTYGLGGFITANSVNKFKLYTIAQYCDAVVVDPDNLDNYIFEGVPNGKGGVEPRYTFNAIINSQADAYNLITSFCGMMGVMPYAGSAGIDFGQDSPREPDILVSPANIIEGSQSYSSTEVKSMYSRINVTWINPDNKYTTEIETVQNAELIQRVGVRELEVTCYSCTSRGQARRYAKLLLDNELYGSELLSYKCGLDHAYIRPGMLIAHSDPQHDSIRKSGRLKPDGVGGDGSGYWFSDFTLDSAYDFEIGRTYTISMVDKYGNVQSASLLTNPGISTTSITIKSTELNNVWWTDVENNSMYMITSDNLEQRLFRVISMQQEDGNTFNVTALLHDPTKYARVEKNEILPLPRTSEYPTSPRLASIDLADIGHQEYMYLQGAQVQAGVNVSWDQPKVYISGGINIGDGRISVYEVEYKYTVTETVIDFEEPWAGAGLTNGLSIDVNNVSTGTYVFRIRSQDDNSRKSDWVEYGPVYLDILLDPPSNVANLIGHASEGQMVLSWDKNSELNVEGYEIRLSSSQTGATWVSNIIYTTVAASVTSVSVPLSTGTYMIKAYTFAGKYSSQASRVISNMASAYNYNAIETVTEQTTFIGVKTRTVVDSLELRLSKQPVMDDWGVMDGVDPLDYGSEGYIPDGYYEFANVVDLGAIYKASVSFNMDADVVDLLGSGSPELSNIFLNPIKNAVPLSGQVVQLVEGEDVGISLQASVTTHSIDLASVDNNGADVTADVSYGGGGTISIFSADNDYIIIGSPDTFDDINFVLGTASSVDVVATFEYSTGVGAWSAFTPTDDTLGFTESGRVMWELSDIPTWALGTGSNFLIRITRTEDTVVTTPVLDIVQNLNARQDLDYILDDASNVTTALSSGGAGNITVFDVDDIKVTVGDTRRFNEIHFVLGTNASVNILPTFEFSAGNGVWTTFSPTDGTSGFTQSGTISWSLNSVASWARGLNGYFQIRITRTEDTVVTSPILNKIELLNDVWGDYNPITFNDYTARAYKFRVYMYTTNFNYSPSISVLETSIAMVDTDLSGNNVASGVAAKTITYSNDFYTTPSVGITAHNMGTGDYFTITSSTKAGFTVEFFDNANETIDVTFDWLAKGYGSEQ
jgi:predicted phage tail protein